MSQKIRIKDIARLAGVSPGTVDRVLHNRGNVSPSARKAIDAVLEQVGLTPTEAVRCLYELVLRHRDRPQELRELLEPTSQEERAAREAERERKVRLAMEGATMCQRFLDEHGITLSSTTASLPYDELRELALMGEYGLLDEKDEALMYGPDFEEARSA